MAEINDTASTDSGDVISIGQKLQQARQAQQMTIEQAARYLRLSESVIKALESDSATADLPATYIRGYVRAYAKLLNLELDQQTPATPVATEHKEVGIVGIQNLQSLPQHYARRRTLSVFSVVIAIVVIGLTGAGVWWWQKGNPFATTTEKAVATDAAAVTTPAIPVTDGVRGEVALNLADDAPVNNSVETTTAAVENAVATKNTDGAKPAETTATVSAPATKSTPDKNEQKSTATEVARGGETIEFVFVEDCWVRVMDGNGEVLAVGTKRSGVRFVVAGPAPLTIDLGNPVGVQMKHNNRPVDLSGYPGGRPAHLTIHATQFE